MNNLLKTLHEILGTTTKVALWVKILAIFMFLFCAWMCTNYFFQHYPDAEVTSRPFDYNGMLVGFFTLLVTLLVGWNIYSTINAKDELDKAVRSIKEQYDKDIADMKADIKRLTKSDIDREIEQAEQKGIEEANEVDKGFVELNLPQEVIEAVEKQMQVQETMLYVWAYNVADEYKTFKQIFEEFKSVQRKHPKRVAYIGGNQATDEKAIEVIKEARDSKQKMLASIRAMRQDTDKKNGDS